MHLGDPVAQAVHDELQRVRVAHIERVAGAGVVHVELLVVIDQTVIGLVVDALERDGRAEVVALRRVVVDHVEHDLDTGVVHRAHHALELLYLLSAIPGGGVAALRREESDGVVAPVIAKPLIEQGRILHELVNRHELEGGDAELLQVLDHSRMSESGVGAALLDRDVGVQLRKSLDMGLVDHGVVVWHSRVSIAGPVEEGIDDDAHHRVAGRVFVVARERVAEIVGEQARIPVKVTAGCLGVRVEEQFVGVAAFARLRIVFARDAIAIALPWLHLREVGVPDVGIDLEQFDPGLDTVVIEQAQLDLLGDLTEQCEVGAAAVEGRAEGIRGSGPGFHGGYSIRSGWFLGPFHRIVRVLRRSNREGALTTRSEDGHQAAEHARGIMLALNTGVR